MNPAVPAAGERLAYLDIAKGLSIVLVALYHSALQPLVPALMQALGLFRLPLFFFVSGLVFRSGRGVAAVARGRGRSLLQPYAVVLGLLLLRSVWKGEADVPAALLGIAWGNGSSIEWVPMWFLPHLWLVCVAAEACWAWTGWRSWGRVRRAAALLALLAGAAALADPDRAWTWAHGGHAVVLRWWPFSADLLPFSLAFFLLGMALQPRSRSFVPASAAVGIAAVAFIGIATGSDALLNLNLRLWRSPLAALVAALCGLYLVLALAHRLAGVGWARRCCTHLGRSSLFILIFHDHVDNKVQALLLPRLGPDHTLAVALVAFAACLSVPLLIREAVLRSRWLSRAFAVPPRTGVVSGR